jgi:Phage tail assembly chaperone protein
MLYVKAIDNQIVAYPYSQTDLVRDNPSTSFPASAISPASLVEWNVFPVHFADQPVVDPLAQRAIEIVPLYDGQSWIQQWAVEAIPQAEIDAMTDQQASSVRADRNARLAATDWRVIKALEEGNGLDFDVATYRQALRDVPSQPGFPWNVVWPVLA